MCNGAILLYGESRTFQGPEAHLHACGVELVVADDPECVRLMEAFIEDRPELWNEDIGV